MPKHKKKFDYRTLEKDGDLPGKKRFRRGKNKNRRNNKRGHDQN